MSNYTVRVMAKDDLDGIVDLHLAAFGARDHNIEDVRAHHQRVLEHHLLDVRVDSPPQHCFVSLHNGVIVGMIYGADSPMRLHDDRVWSTCTAYFSVHPDHRNPSCTKALIHASYEAGRHIVLSDRTNAPARRVGERATKGHTHQQYSLRWSRVLNPATAAAGGLLNRSRRSQAWIAPTLRRATTFADSLLQRREPALVAIEEPRSRRRLTTTELTADDLAEHGDALLQQFTLRPDVTSAELTQAGWARFRAVRPEGQIYRRAVWNKKGALVGWYIFHAQRTGIAEVLQLVGGPDVIDGVISLLLEHASDVGVGSLHGTASPTMFVPLSEAGAYYHGRGSTLFVRSTDPEVDQAFSSSRALLTGFEGEYPMMMAPRNALD